MAISEHLMKTGKIWVDAPCEPCKGTGRTEVREYCKVCDGPLLSSYPAEERESWGDKMPCGCEWSNCRSEDYCGECDGSGKGGAFVTIADLLAILTATKATGKTFSVGDRVKFIKPNMTMPNTGDCGEVIWVGVSQNKQHCRVRFDDGDQWHCPADTLDAEQAGTPNA